MINFYIIKHIMENFMKIEEKKLELKKNQFESLKDNPLAFLFSPEIKDDDVLFLLGEYSLTCSF